MNLSPLAPVKDLVSAGRQHTSTSVTDHRPWPMPERKWWLGQSWLDLLFAHWRVDEEAVRELLPPELEPDIIDGSAWIAVTPFELRAMRLRLSLPAVAISSFPELNVRTYVTVDGKPGIYFFSLDADSHLAVAGARRAFRFPYFHARMSIQRGDRRIHYRSDRHDSDGLPAALSATYAPVGPAFYAEPGSLEWRLIERYCAYTLDDRGQILRANIHHRPWELHCAEAVFLENTMTAPLGIELEGEPLLHYSPRQDVIIWPHEVAVATDAMVASPS